MALLQDPATRAEAVTPSDSTIHIGIKSVYVGGAGNVAMILRGNGAAVTFNNVPAGTTLFVQARQIMSTGTTASNIVALF